MSDGTSVEARGRGARALQAAATRPAGVALLALAATCVALLAGVVDGVRERGDLSALDPGFTARLVSMRTPTLSSVAHAVTWLGSVPILIALAVGTTVALGMRWHSRRPVVVMGVALGGSAVLTYALKVIVARQRPPVADMLGAVDRDFAFPSGHTLNSAVFLAVLCWLLWSRTPVARRVPMVTVAVLLGAAVGLSRIYLGYHWLTDVLGGWLVALAWLSLLLGVWRLSRPVPPAA